MTTSELRAISITDVLALERDPNVAELVAYPADLVADTLDDDEPTRERAAREIEPRIVPAQEPVILPAIGDDEDIEKLCDHA